MAQNNPGAVVVFLVIIFLTLNSGGPPLPIIDVRAAFDQVVDSEQASLDLLRGSSYGDFVSRAQDDHRWFNLTGLRREDAYQWSLLPKVQERARERLNYVAGEPGIEVLDGAVKGSLLLYQNVTGFVRGQWVHSKAIQGIRDKPVNLTALTPHMEYFSPIWGRNLTGDGGKMSLRLTERLPRSDYNLEDHTRPISARLTIQDETSSGDGWAMKMYGVHHSHSGSIVLTTSSEKFDGYFALPHLALSQHSFESSKALLNKSIQRTIDAQRDDPRGVEWSPWSSLVNEDSPSQPLCELVVYLQQQPLGQGLHLEGGNYSSHFFDLEDLERDLRFPSGIYDEEPPKLTMSMTAFSPDCGFVIESKGPPEAAGEDAIHLEGPKAEVYVRRTKSAMVFFMLVYAVQLILLGWQMKASSTPSTRGRISYTSLSMLNMGSGFTAFGFLMLSSFVDSIFLDAMILAFLAFLDGNYIGMRFVLDVWSAQEPERMEVLRVQERERTANYNAFVARINARIGPPGTPFPMAQGLPLPATAASVADAAAVPPLSRSGTPEPALPSPISSASHDEASQSIAQSTTSSAPPSATPEVPSSAPPTSSLTTTPTPAAILSVQPLFQPSPFLERPNDFVPTTRPLTLPPLQPLRPPTFGALYARFSLALLILVFVSLSAFTSWPVIARTIFANLLVFGYCSLWLPQIYRNILRNTRKALLWRFAIGQSCLRLLPIAYFWCVEGNVLDTEVDRATFMVLVVWLSLQLLVLGSQEFLGPRWFVNEKWSWIPEAWDWRPVLREDDEEASLLPVGGTVVEAGMGYEDEEGSVDESNGLVAGLGLGKERVYECAICMESVRVPLVPGTSSSGARRASRHSHEIERPRLRQFADARPWTRTWRRFWDSARRKAAEAAGTGPQGVDEKDYAITPCRHVFHGHCISNWLQYRSACPNCRESLPTM
jgi:hypothetical protein